MQTGIPAKMNQWPPSPCVEDEETALANEHSLDASVQSLKSEDQPAPSRGSVDQYPIIIDSPTPTRPEKTQKKDTSQEPSFADGASSDDSAGPPTPPPMNRKEQKRSSQPLPQNNFSQPVPRSAPQPVVVEQQTSNRGRPQVTRIQTNVANDVHIAAASSRRPPSPYSQSRPQTYHEPVRGYPPLESFLSPTQAVNSPISVEQQRQKPPTARRGSDRPDEKSTPRIIYHRSKSERRDDQPETRDSPSSRYSAQLQPEPRTPRSARDSERRRSFYDAMERPSLEPGPRSPGHSRRQSRDYSYGSSGEEKTGYYIDSSTARRDIRDSPYTSTDESSRELRRKGGNASSDEQRTSRRKSEHRRERPSFVDLGKDLRPDSMPASAIDGPESRYYRREPRDKSQLNVMTPVTGDAGKAAMEDYFERAFRDHNSRKSRGPRSSGSTLTSPLSSPPRTPKSERQAKDYFDVSSSTQRPLQRSRPPSMDEGQLKDLKSHNTLLSAATAGAAHAAKTSGSSSRSAKTSPENSSSTVTSKPASAPRSRRPSPVHDDSDVAVKTTSYSPASTTLTSRGPLTPTLDNRSFSRGNSIAVDHAISHPHPQRALSYSGYDRGQPYDGPHPGIVSSTTYPPPTSAGGHIGSQPVPPSRSTRGAANSTEMASTINNNIVLPNCPRSQPSVGQRDWYTIKEISDVEICPTCMSVLGTTRYRSLFVPSLPRPYSEPSVCGMSKPWIRIAFLQSLRQNRPDLRYIHKVANPPKEVRACLGTKADIRHWFQVIDPLTKEPIPDFFACTACVSAIDAVFPDVGTVLERPKPKLNQEKSCNLTVMSKHFNSIIDQLDQSQLKCQGRRWRASDVEPLVRHVRKIARSQPCARDELQASRAWHFTPDLPEFTICEECYDEVVAPINDRYLARDICRSLKIVPLRRGSNGTSGISCQLYSDRMRKAFRDAVHYRDIGPLRDVVRTRVSTQQRLIELNKLYEKDLRAGIDRRAELAKNQDIWRSFE